MGVHWEIGLLTLSSTVANTGNLFLTPNSPLFPQTGYGQLQEPKGLQLTSSTRDRAQEMPCRDGGYRVRCPTPLPTCLLPVLSPHLSAGWLCPVPLVLGTSLKLLGRWRQSLQPPTPYLVFTPCNCSMNLTSTKRDPFTHASQPSGPSWSTCQVVSKWFWDKV